MRRLLAYPLLALVLGACVTINIYFPAAAAEEAARTIVRDVLKGEGDGEKGPPAGQPQSSVQPESGVSQWLLVGLGRTLELLVAPAQAGQADININTAGIGAIRASMQQRQSSLAPFYRSGAIGFDANGSVAVRDLAAVALGDRNKLKKLVADENADRADLYREIARANGHPEWEGDVRSTFAKVWVQEALSGYWYQQGGTWKQR
ncbi:MAG: YdbL family protein [Gammaproteobacteria bacterium]|nr:YdbL family protein [Gammaproteobacteria bacterium]MCP5299665.1 YdbL family protein [Chromatiaceae bacterium]